METPAKVEKLNPYLETMRKKCIQIRLAVRRTAFHAKALPNCLFFHRQEVLAAATTQKIVLTDCKCGTPSRCTRVFQLPTDLTMG